MAEFSHLQDSIGQLGFLKTYSQISLGFRTPPRPDDEIFAGLAAARGENSRGELERKNFCACA